MNDNIYPGINEPITSVCVIIWYFLSYEWSCEGGMTDDICSIFYHMSVLNRLILGYKIFCKGGMNDDKVFSIVWAIVKYWIG